MRSRASALMLAPCWRARWRLRRLTPPQRRTGEHRAVHGDVVDSRRGRDAGEHRLRHDRGGLRPAATSAAGARSCSLRPSRQRRSRRAGIEPTPLADRGARRQDEALGDSPNPFFNVYRSYSEPGGIADEMRATAAANPDVMKLEQIGDVALGKPILAIKMTADARNVPDGARPALLFSAINHAREWIAAEQGRRLPVWFAEHKNDPKIKEIIGKTASSGSCRSRTSTATTSPSPAASAPTQVTVRLPHPPAGKSDEPLLAQDAARQQQQRDLRRQPGRRRPEPQLPGQARDRRRGREQQHLQRHLPRPVRAVGAGEPRRRPPPAARQVLRQHQLPHRRPAAADAGVATRPTTPRRTRRSSTAMTGTDGDAAVFPYQPQRSSDLYESNGDTIDNGVPELRHHRLDAGDGHLRHRAASRRAATSSRPRTTRPRSRPSSRRTSRSR